MEGLRLRPVAVVRQPDHAAERRRVEHVADAHDAVRVGCLQLAADAAVHLPLLEGRGAPPLSPVLVEDLHITCVPDDDHSNVDPVENVGRLPVELHDGAHAARYEATVAVQGLLRVAGADAWASTSTSTFHSREDLMD